jgi:hypothetical protein
MQNQEQISLCSQQNTEKPTALLTVEEKKISLGTNRNMTMLCNGA